MRLLLTFIIFILGGFYTFGKESCCEQCCEYLGNCCKKGKEEVKNGNNVKEKKEGEEDGVQEEFCLKKTEAANSEEIKKLVDTDWYDNKWKEASFILYEKIDDAENQNINKKDVIKIKKDKNGFSIDKNFITENDNNAQKWALFEIIYKKKGEGEEKEDKEKETKYLYCSDIESDNINGIFESCEQHISISVIACDTSEVINMANMFYDCSSLTKLNLSKFDTKKVTDMALMFWGCTSLTELNLSNFNTETVTCMCAMFSGCASLQQLDLSNFNTENVTDMESMFYGCASLQQLDLTNFNTDNVTNISSMFYGCEKLKNLDFSKFNLKNVTNKDSVLSGIPEENLKSFTSWWLLYRVDE